MKKYPKIGIRPTIDGRQGGVRESLEEKTMSLAKAVAELISSNLKNGDGSPVECVIADGTIGRVAESAACALLSESRVGLQRNGASGCRLSGCRIGWSCSEGSSSFWHLWP